MKFPNPPWAKRLDNDHREAALRMLESRLFAIYAPLDTRLSKVSFQDDEFSIPLPRGLKHAEACDRTRFLLHLAALYTSERGSFRALSLVCGMHPMALSTMSRRNRIPANLARRVALAVGEKLLPRTTLNPEVFG